MRRDLLTAFLSVIVLHDPARPRLPAARHRRQPGRLPGQGQRLADQARRRRRRLGADRPAVLRARDRQERQAGDGQGRRPDPARPALLPDAAVGQRRDNARRARSSRTSAPTTRRRWRRSRATSRPTSRSTGARREPYDPALTSAAQIPVDAVDRLGVVGRPRHLGRQRRHPGLPRSPPSATSRWATVDALIAQVHARAQPRLPRRARRQRARAQPRPRPPHREQVDVDPSRDLGAARDLAVPARHRRARAARQLRSSSTRACRSATR